MTRISKNPVLGCLTILSLIPSLIASDWNTWLGPNEDNTVRAADSFETDLHRWRIAWTAEVGRGYSTITTSGDRAYTNGHDEESNESILCIDIHTGQRLWSYTYEAALMPRAHGGGPNASIILDENRLYSISKDGQLHCLNQVTGKLIWKTRLTTLLDIEVPSWGFGGSPILDGDHLIVAAGKIVKLDKASGEIIWVTEVERRASYGTPVLFRNRKVDYIAAMDGNGFAIYKAETGDEILHKRMVTKSNVVSNTPMVFDEGERIFIHTNAFSEVLAFDGKEIEVVWNDRKLQNSQSAAVLVNDTLYGLNGLPENNRTKLYARNPASGETYWSVPNFGFGSLVAVGKHLLILTDDGELVTTAADPSMYRELSRIKVLEPTCWTKPIFIPGYIFARNDAGQLICLMNP